MKHVFITILLLFLFGITKAQTSIDFYQYIPKGYQLKNVNEELGPSVNIDFDNDGIKDLAIIVFDIKFGSPILCIFLSTNLKTSKIFKYLEWEFMMHTLKLENGVLSLFSDNGSMGQYGLIEMKYDNVKKDFKVIKFEDVLGNKSIKFNVGNLKMN